MLILLVYIAVYVGFVSIVGTALAGSSNLLQLIFYIVMGFAWILPLKPFFAWMNSGTNSGED